MSKLRVGVIFGGRSGEHEVSLMSAKSVLNALDPQKYEVTPVAITKSGKWRLAGQALELIKQGKLPNIADDTIPSGDNDISLVPDPTSEQPFDVVFPVLHGTYGEDGTIQGLLDLANIPYVGAGVTSSAVSMDKAMMRVLFASVGLPLAPWVTVLRSRWEVQPDKVIEQIESHLSYPCFVKPANLGSSVGISKANNDRELAQAMDLAAEYDRKLVIEQGLIGVREIEVSVLGNDDPKVSVPGEVIPGNEFYDYRAKYLQDNSQLIIPADISQEQTRQIQEYALKAFKAVDCSGMARIDFFLTSGGEVLVNEINTIPGFTRISMYPKLWEASGVSFGELIDTLIMLAVERHKDRLRCRTEFN